ncbi:MAG: hypothetical protein AB1898_12475 [Acidobacteriota bacterium]
MERWSRASLCKVASVALLALVSSWLPDSAAFAAGGEEELRLKLQEFDERLKKLEHEQAEKTVQLSEAGDREQATQKNELQELRQQLDILAAEIERLRSGERLVEVSPDQARALGLAPSAASTYRKERGVSIAGYGEMLYQNFDSSNEGKTPTNRGSQFDFLRAILYAGYRFNDKVVFNSEIELEHTDEISLEFAYIDYLAKPYLTFRGGLLLIPMGLTNEFHEPNVFLGSLRPQTETRILPSTWRENGFGVLGSAGMLSYRAYLVNGLNAAGFTSDGLRGGRQKGGEAKSSDMAFVGRLDVSPTPGVFFGGSFYTGNSGQGQFLAGGRQLGVRTNIGELHGQVQVRGFDLRGLYARAVLDDVAELNAARSLAGQSSIGEAQHGGYLQFGYNLLARRSENVRVTPYYRFEKLNTQARVPLGFVVDPARDRTFHTFGFEFRPIYNVVVKSDYQWTRNQARTGLNQLNLVLGYSF